MNHQLCDVYFVVTLVESMLHKTIFNYQFKTSVPRSVFILFLIICMDFVCSICMRRNALQDNACFCFF